MIGTVFGGLWALIAAFALPSAWHLPVAALAVFLTAALVVSLLRARDSSTGTTPLFMRRPYRFAVIAEVVLIYGASLILPRMGLQSYFMQAVGVIVGLHFIGLWAATQSPRFINIAVAMCAVSIASAILPIFVGLIHIRDFATGAGNALVLWACTRPSQRKA